jgi:hypothetical protein
MTNYSRQDKLLILGEEGQEYGNINTKLSLDIIQDLKILDKMLDDKIKHFI